MSIRKFIATTALALTATLGATAARAGDIHWSVGINLPPVGTVISNAPVYHAPPVVYAPAPVVVHRPPHVVYAPPPAVVYRPAPRVVYVPHAYGQRPHHRHHHYKHKHHVRHGHDHWDQWDDRRGHDRRGHDHRR